MREGSEPADAAWEWADLCFYPNDLAWDCRAPSNRDGGLMQNTGHKPTRTDPAEAAAPGQEPPIVLRLGEWVEPVNPRNKAGLSVGNHGILELGLLLRTSSDGLRWVAI